MQKIHKKGLICGSNISHLSNDCFTQNSDDVTCVRCKRLINDSLPNKLYRVSVDRAIESSYLISAPTSSKAVYRCFKNFFYDGELCEDIGDQFAWFKKYKKPKPTVEKDLSLQPTLTWDEQEAFNKSKTEKQCEEWNTKYPIGTLVLFQADGESAPVTTFTRSNARVNGDYMVIWLEGVSGSYKLDDRWIRPLTEENKNLHALR